MSAGERDVPLLSLAGHQRAQTLLAPHASRDPAEYPPGASLIESASRPCPSRRASPWNPPRTWRPGRTTRCSSTCSVTNGAVDPRARCAS